MKEEGLETDWYKNGQKREETREKGGERSSVHERGDTERCRRENKTYESL